MKCLIKLPFLALLLSTALVMGCSEKAEDAAKTVGEKTQEASEKAVETAKEIKNDVQEASQKATEAAGEKLESAVAWTKDKMDAYKGEMKEKLGNLDSQLEGLNSKAGMLGADAKQKFQEQFAAVGEKKEAVAKKMEEMEGASGETWEKAKQELDNLMDELAQLYENIKKGFSAS